MKKSRILALLSAFTITAVSSVPMISSAKALFADKLGTLEDVENSFSPNDILVFPYDDGSKKKMIMILNSDDSCCQYAESKEFCVTVKKGTSLNKKDVFEKISAELGNISVSGRFIQLDENMYMIDMFSPCKNENVLNAMNKYDNVVSADYRNAVAENTLCGVSGVHIDSDLTHEEFETKYPSLKWNENLECFDFDTNDINTFDVLKSILNDTDIKSAEPIFIVATSMNNDYLGAGKSIENLYTAAIKGDVNGDGEVDISDVVAITAFVGNSEKNKFNSDQKIINGDVYNSGDGLTANDALMIQQYISGNLESLE